MPSVLRKADKKLASVQHQETQVNKMAYASII